MGDRVIPGRGTTTPARSADAIELTVRWGALALFTSHVRRGDERTLRAAGVPPGEPAFEREWLGDRDAWAVVRDGSFRVVPGAEAEVETGGVVRALEAGTERIAIGPGVVARQRLGPLLVEARCVRAARPWRARSRVDAVFVAATVLSALLVGGTVFALGMQAGGARPGERLEALRALIARQTKHDADATRAVAPEPACETLHGRGEAHDGPEGVAARAAIARRWAHRAASPRDVPPAAHASAATTDPPGAAARRAMLDRGVFAAMAPDTRSSAAPTLGVPSPFASLVADDEPGGLNAVDVLGVDGGYDGLGASGTGAGGGGRGEGTVGIRGLLRVNVRGPGNGSDMDGVYGACGCGPGMGTRGRALAGGALVSRAAAVVRAPRPADAAVEGLLSREQIRRVVAQNLGQVRHCYEQSLASDPTLAGRVTVQWVIGADGAVLGAAVVARTLESPEAAGCIASAVRRWRFPAPTDGVVSVTYPFDLRVAE